MKGLIDMLKRNWQIAAMVVVLAAVGGFGFKGCSEQDKKDFEKNARVAVRIGATAAGEISAELKSYCRAELLKPESCEKAIPHADKIADISGRANRFLDAHPKITSVNRDELFALLDDSIKELDALEADGVIEFKDPEKRRKFLLGVAFSRSGLRIARVALQEMPLKSPSPSPSPSPQ